MFVQGPRGSDRSQGGLGLGLSLVRTLTALHGGTVSAHSDGPGRGSSSPCACRRRRAALTGDARAAPVTRRIAGDRARRVLVVDDNRDARGDDLASCCRTRVTRCASRSDPSQALSAVDAFRPQVAILDIGLPVMDGYALGRELRARLGRRARRS